jgi:hypothetical protein
MPLWAIILFVLSFFFTVAFISNRVKQAAMNAGMAPNKARNIQYGILGFYIIYLTYVSMFSLKGLFDNNSIPPSVMVFGGIPLMIILFGIIGNTSVFKKLLRSITLESLITMHVFRVVGVFFILLYYYHLLPAEFAFSAGIGDLITALLAFPLAGMVSKGNSWSIKAIYAWNIFGILDILTLLVIAALDVKNAIVTGGPGDRELTIFPFVLFPAFAPATILFLHTVIFRKLIQIKKAKYSLPIYDSGILEQGSSSHPLKKA